MRVRMDEDRQTRKKGIPNSPLAFFIYALSPHKKWLIFAIFAVTIASIIGASSSYLYKLIIDAVEKGDLKSALVWGLLFPVVMFIMQVLYRVGGFATANLATRTNKSTIDKIHSYILKHSHGYFIDRFAGSISNKVRNVIGALEDIVPELIFTHLNIFVGFFVTFILIFITDVNSSILFLLLILVLLLINKYLAPEKTRLAKLNAEIGTVLQGRTVDVLSNVSAVRQYAMRDYELGELRKLTKEREEASLKNWLYTEKLLLINVLILFIFTFAMCWSLITKWGNGLISTGDFVLVLALVTHMSSALLFIGRAFNAMARTIGELKEGLEEILVDYDIVDASEAKPLVVTGGSIAWQDVDFKFGDNQQVFVNFNLEIPAGQRVGLVGTSGAGKTTFVSLLLRQHELNGGTITIDGQDIANVTQDSLRQAISVVPQEPALFHRSIRENIAYSCPDVGLDEVIAVAKQAHAHEFIEKLPQGYDTMVGERGVKLSGGQKQRVAIARAMLKNAPILILDEATSALDSESEILIQKALHKLMVGKTVIAIAHRLSTLREMDRIIVLDSGLVVEDGDHQSLKDKEDGVYSKLWNHQSNGFITEQ